MENEEKIVVLDKYPNAIDANIVKGALEASGIPAGVIVDNTANAIWMAPVRVVVFERDIELAIQAIYGGEVDYKDYQDEMTPEQFENLQACNKAFCAIALKCHPVIDKSRSDLYAVAKDALANCDLPALDRIQASLQ